MARSTSSKPASSKPVAGLAEALGHSTADKRIDILRGIGRSGSISQAARDAAVSYKAAWQAVATLTNLAGEPLVERAVGGAGGGGARLTRQGEELLRLAQAYEQARHAVVAATPAHASGKGGGGAGVAVAGLRIRTSMRNQLPGTVRALERHGRQVRVLLVLGSEAEPARGTELWASITHESAQLLGLAVGLPAIALCKATAVRMAPAGEAPAEAREGNVLDAQVTGISRAQAVGEADELTVTLAGCALQLVGFAPQGVTLRRRQHVRAWVDASAVVIALAG